jgi:Mn2+/Fe2+ NRAMP family transporter
MISIRDVGHLYNYFFLVVFLIGIAIVFFASEFGWRLGIRTKGHGASGNISALEQSLLEFLALLSS